MTERERFESFKAAVESDSEAKAEAIKAQAQLEAQEYAKTLGDEQTALLAKKSLEIENDKQLGISRETAGRELAAKRAVLAYREELIDALFEKVRAKLKSMASAGRHKEYVLSCVEQTASQYKGVKGICYLSPEHSSLAEIIKSQFGYEVRTDDKLILGGVNIELPELSVLIDRSVASALEQERADFAKNNKELGL